MTESELLKRLEDAFWDLADLAGENLPDYYDDDEGEEYVNECSSRYDQDVSDFKKAVSELKKLKEDKN